MYIIKAKTNNGYFEKEYKIKKYAVLEAGKTATSRKLYWNNPELNKEQRTFTVYSVTIYDTENPDLDINF